MAKKNDNPTEVKGWADLKMNEIRSVAKEVGFKVEVGTTKAAAGQGLLDLLEGIPDKDPRLTKAVVELYNKLVAAEDAEKPPEPGAEATPPAPAATPPAATPPAATPPAPATKTPARKKDPAKVKAAPKPRYTRVMAVADAFKAAKKYMTIDELAAAADALYSKGGGAANVKEAKWYCNYAVQIFIHLGLAEYNDDGKIRWAKK